MPKYSKSWPSTSPNPWRRKRARSCAKSWHRQSLKVSQLLVLLSCDLGRQYTSSGARLPSIQIAANKAWTAAREQIPTRELGQRSRHPEDGFNIAYFGDQRYIGWGGGLPVIVDGSVIGAVAVSGLPEAEDMELAALGVAEIFT